METRFPLRALTIQEKTLRVEHHTVIGRSQQVCDVAGSLESPELQETPVLTHGFADELGATRLTLRPDDNRLRKGVRACP